MALQDATRIQQNSTRWQVLSTLREVGRATVSEVAERVKVKGVTVRHHLNSLHADGLVAVDEERREVGRPAHVYRLTRKAERLFPHSYHLLIDRLLSHLKSELPADQVRGLMESLAESMAADVQREVANLPPEERRARLLEVLDELGLAARWQQSEEGLALVKYHCPYYAVGEQHPELCQIDEALVQVVMEGDVERAACLLSGDAACSLTVS